jgi:iron complex transport system substrate-binding protein
MPPATLTLALRRAAFVVVILVAGCGREAPAPEVAPSGTAAPQRASSPMRIVSLSPAITRTLIDLGLGGAIVGRTPFCEGLPEEVPAVGSLLELDYERLLATRPTHVLVQPPAGGLDPELERLAALRGWTLRAWSLATIADVERLLEDLGALVIDAARARALPECDAVEAARRAGARRAALWLLRARGPGADAPRVAILFGREAFAGIGTGTFLGELLEGIGRRNAIVSAGYPETSLEDLATLRADAILLLVDGPDDGGAALARLRGALPRTPIAAARLPNALLPSSALDDVALELDWLLDELGALRVEVNR